MNAWHPPSHLRLWAARFLAAAGAIFAVAPALFSPAGDQPYPYAYALRLPVDALAIWLAGKRRYRFTAALWFGCSALFHLLSAVDSSGLQVWGFAAALPMTLATALLVWPLLRAPNEQTRLAPLSGVWVLVATLVMTAMDATLSRGFGSLSRDTVMVAGMSALGLFAGCMISSHLGPLRWLGQLGTIVIIGVAQSSELGGSTPGAIAAMDLAKLVTWLGLGTFALGLDWIRAGTDGRTRFLRAGALSLGATLAPLALVAWWSPLGWPVVAMAVARAAALGLTAAIMPRVAGCAKIGVRRASAVGRPPWVLLGFIGALAAVGTLILLDEREAIAIWMLAVLVPVSLCLVIRTRLTRAALFLMAGLPLMVTALAYGRHGHGFVVSFGTLAAAALFSVCISGPKAGKHFQRRFRWAGVPHPRVSLALAGAAAAAVLGPLVFTSITQPESRPGLLAAAGGAIPLPVPLYFRSSVIRDAPSPGRRTGSTVAADPLGRGTWVVDEEREEVALVGPDNQVRRFPVGEWPELLVVTGEGRVFVSCREAARIDVIEPDFQRRAIEVGDEVRGLALDPSEDRLYAGLLITRALEAFDTRTLERVGHLDLPTDPRSVAVTSNGVATLPDRGSAVEMASADLRRHWSMELPSGEGVAWHGQALLPAGRDLLVLHTQVKTGLDHPVSSGGYGGAVSQPINLVATVIQGGRVPLVPPNARSRAGDLDVPDVAGAALGEDALYLASRIGGKLERIPYRNGLLDPTRRNFLELLAEELERDTEPSSERLASGNGLTGVALQGGRVLTFAAFDRVLVAAPMRDSAHPILEVKLGAGHLNAQMALGRRLFFRNDRAISAADLACASCHTDGREDGLVWRLQGGRLQTPSLAGRVADTAPYNWHGTTRTLPDNIAQTITRLGGNGLPPEEREALARYLSRGLRPVREAPSGDPAAVAQGRALFHDRTVGCSSCHDPDSAFTDGQAHDVESLTAKEREELKASGQPVEATAGVFDTPTLRQVGLTAPYFHDGSARSLEEVVERNGDKMGKTSQLSADERRALVAYLRTL